MKNIIPAIALGFTLHASPVLADETIEKTGEKSNSILAMNMPQNISAKEESGGITNDVNLQESWNRNAEKIAESLLPGNPVSFRQDYYKGLILYKLGSDKDSRLSTYAGVYDAPGGIRTMGVIFEFKLGK